MSEQALTLQLGDSVYTEDGRKLGTVRGFDDSGCYVTTRAEVESPSPTSSTGGTGEMDLMWRCWQCGEVGRIDEIPDECPSCGAPSEDLYYWSED